MEGAEKDDSTTEKGKKKKKEKKPKEKKPKGPSCIDTMSAGLNLNDRDGNEINTEIDVSKKYLTEMDVQYGSKYCKNKF